MAKEIATFGAGCFWGVEETFRRQKGVLATRVGYAGGHTDQPDYHAVCTDRTGHAEVVEVTFDPAETSYADLVSLFWELHDPTQLNRQGPDVGSQYRSVIFTHSDEQMRQAKLLLAKAQKSFSRPIVTAIEPTPLFWEAEEYHQKYLQKRGQGSCGI